MNFWDVYLFGWCYISLKGDVLGEWSLHQAGGFPDTFVTKLESRQSSSPNMWTLPFRFSSHGGLYIELWLFGQSEPWLGGVLHNSVQGGIARDLFDIYYYGRVTRYVDFWVKCYVLFLPDHTGMIGSFGAIHLHHLLKLAKYFCGLFRLRILQDLCTQSGLKYRPVVEASSCAFEWWCKYAAVQIGSSATDSLHDHVV